MAEPPGAVTDADDTDGAAEKRPRRRSRRQLAILLALTLAVVVLIGAGAVFGLRLMQHDADEARRQDAIRTASDVAVKLTTIDHRNADRDLGELRAVATPQFAEQFGILSHAFADTVRQSQIVSTGQVTSAGVQHADDRNARILVAVRATVRDGNAPEGEPRNYRLGVDLVREDDTWLVSNVEFIL